MGRGGGFEISDIPNSRTGEEVVCESSDVRKFLKKSKFQNFSELFKVKTRNYNRSRFQYEAFTYDVCSNLGIYTDLTCLVLSGRALIYVVYHYKWYTTYVYQGRAYSSRQKVGKKNVVLTTA